MTENHKKFLQHLTDSEGAVWKVARWLHGKGYQVVLPPTSKAESHADWRDHADGGDLFIAQRVEIKRLSVSFTCRNDWPFGSKFIVCAKHAFDRARPKPFAYVILSHDQQYAAIVMAATYLDWKVENKQDSRYDQVAQDFYLAPMDCVQFVSLK